MSRRDEGKPVKRLPRWAHPTVLSITCVGVTNRCCPLLPSRSYRVPALLLSVTKFPLLRSGIPLARVAYQAARRFAAAPSYFRA